MSFSSNSILILILTVLFVDRLKQKSRSNIIMAWIANFFGTFFHELLHLIVSVILNGKPNHISLFPSKNEKGGYTLGYVNSSNITWYNAFPIAMAPLSLLYLAYLLNSNYSYFLFEPEFYKRVIYLFLLISLLDSSIPSRQDFKVAFSNFGFIIWIGLFLVEEYFFNNVGLRSVFEIIVETGR